MKQIWACRIAGLALLLAGGQGRLPAAPAATPEKKAAARSAESTTSLELRGRVVCLPEEMHRRYGAPLPTSHEHIWGFQGQDGQIYTLLRGKFSEAIFVDERVRAKELWIKARRFPKSNVLEILTLRSLRQGVMQDLYYYCDICAIKAVSPDPCACCQGPMELVEQPWSKRDD